MPSSSTPQVTLEVTLRAGGDLEQCLAVDVARRGLYLRCATPYSPEQLVHLTLHLPRGDELSVHGMIERVLGPSEAAAEGVEPGVSVRFYGLGLQARQQWESFLEELDQRLAPPPADSNDDGETAAADTSSAPPWSREASVLMRPKKPTQPPPPRRLTPLPQRAEPPQLLAPTAAQGHVVYRLLLPTVEAVAQFAGTALSAGGVFIRTGDVRLPGTPAIVCVVRPDSCAEFHLPGKVRAADERGVSIAFTAVTPQTVRGFQQFAAPDAEHSDGLAECEESPPLGTPRESNPYLELSITELSRECEPSELIQSLAENTEELRVNDIATLLECAEDENDEEKSR